MSLTSDQVRRVAHLARMRMSDAEVTAMAGQLNGILQWIEQLNEVDVGDVTHCDAHTPAGMHERADVAGFAHGVADILANAPETAHDMFSVPKMVE